jgi:hypothetical protein
MDNQDSFHSLLDYECLLFRCDWLCSHLRMGHFLTSIVRWLTPHGLTFNNNCYLTDFSFTTQWPLAYEWIGWRLQLRLLNELTNEIFYNSRRTEDPSRPTRQWPSQSPPGDHRVSTKPLMLFREVHSVYSADTTESMSARCGFLQY